MPFPLEKTMTIFFVLAIMETGIIQRRVSSALSTGSLRNHAEGSSFVFSMSHKGTWELLSGTIGLTLPSSESIYSRKSRWESAPRRDFSFYLDTEFSFFSLLYMPLFVPVDTKAILKRMLSSLVFKSIFRTIYIFKKAASLHQI